MTLAEYMAKNGYLDHVAKAIGVTRETVLRYRHWSEGRPNGLRPDWKMASRITRWSNGVIPLDAWVNKRPSEYWRAVVCTECGWRGKQHDRVTWSSCRACGAVPIIDGAGEDEGYSE
jgi:hypothetical protein